MPVVDIGSAAAASHYGAFFHHRYAGAFPGGIDRGMTAGYPPPMIKTSVSTFLSLPYSTLYSQGLIPVFVISDIYDILYDNIIKKPPAADGTDFIGKHRIREQLP